MENQPSVHTYDSSFAFDVDLSQLHRQNSCRYPYLLESVAQGNNNGRYDILLAFPQQSLILDCSGQELGYKTHNSFSGMARVKNSDAHSFLDEFHHWFLSEKTSEQAAWLSNVPFIGGWFVYLGYELAQQIEPTLVLPRQEGNFPTAFATRIPAAIIKDHILKRLTVVVEKSHSQLLETIKRDIQHAPTPSCNPGNTPLLDLVEEATNKYLSSVKKIKQYIKNGDVFQVNLSRKWQVKLTNSTDYMQLYHNLRYHNPAPYFALIKFENNIVLSSSPERLVRVSGDTVETRPIAGTRPTSENQDFDSAFQKELLAHPKERAEHVMLIDLERNDMGRVCRPGSIEVNELMVLESYAHVHHIVSNIKGRLAENITPSDVIRAVFPGGTITGCPKVRCMEIIAELEMQGRGPYTGSIGYINTNGSMDLNILIRTMTLCGTDLSFRAGAGIVSDSKPEQELLETRAKARGLLLALGLSK